MIDALLAVDADSLPPEIEWAELGDYFAARAVAELTRAEFAIAMHRLWLEIWEPIIKKRWDLPLPGELDEAGQGVSTGVIWDEKVFYLYHRCGKRELYTLVGVDRRKVTVAFSVEQRDKALIKGGLDDFTWRDDGQWPAWMLYMHGILPDSERGMDVTPLRAAAEAAMAAVDATPEPTRRKPAALAPKRTGKSGVKSSGRRG